MNRSATLLILIALLSACQREAPPEGARDDARDIAMVENAQKVQPPVQPVTPDPVSFADLDTPGTDIRLPTGVAKPKPGDGCSFVAANAASDAPVFVALPQIGLIKHSGEIEDFGVDSGSDVLPGGLHTRYMSGAHALTLTRGEGDKASLTLRDPYDRVVYFSVGELRCAG